jgi:prolyl-tRNA synthetase
MTVDVSDYGDLTDLFRDAGLISKGYPVKGCYVWRPFGMRIKTSVFELVTDRFEAADYEQYQFPRLVHGDSIRTVSAEIEDFRSGLYWLRRSDGTPTDVFLTPTGECSVYTMLAKWINHESDLPMRLYQQGPVFRSHSDPRPILSGDEVTDLAEAHGAFATEEAAVEEFDRIHPLFEDLFDRLGIPRLSLKRPKAGNNPVYEDMYSYDTYLPSRGKSCNVGCLYDQRQIYSRALDVSFTDQQGNSDNTYQVTFGISERIVAIMLDLHRDEHGLRLLPSIAPTQVQIIPVYGEIQKGALDEYARRIESTLSDTYRVDIDDRDTNAGKRLAEARTKGVPVRIGVSAQNRRNGDSRVYLRTQSEPHFGIPLEDLPSTVSAYLQEVREEIISDAETTLNEHVVDCETIENTRTATERGRTARIYWCGDRDCLDELDATLPGELLGRPADASDHGVCLVCGSSAQPAAYFGMRVSA